MTGTDVFINNMSSYNLRFVVVKSNFGETLNVIVYDVDGEDFVLESKSNKSIIVQEEQR